MKTSTSLKNCEKLKLTVLRLRRDGTGAVRQRSGAEQASDLQGNGWRRLQQDARGRGEDVERVSCGKKNPQSLFLATVEVCQLVLTL